jgi:hypothetical protein
MKPYKVRNHKGQSIVAEFETQPEAAAYLQSQDNPLLYVDFDEPKPVVEPRKPTEFDIFLEKNITKPWFRYLFGGALVWIGFLLIDKPNGWAGWILMVIGCLFMYEIGLIALVGGFVYFILSSVGNLSIPAAILVGACIIGFAIYKKKS